MPLEYLLGIMHDKGQDARRGWTLPKRLPLPHARLTSTELSDGPVSVQTSQKLDKSDLTTRSSIYWNVRFGR